MSMFFGLTIVFSFLWLFMYAVGWWLYHTDAMYKAEFGKPKLWPWAR